MNRYEVTDGEFLLEHLDAWSADQAAEAFMEDFEHKLTDHFTLTVTREVPDNGEEWVEQNRYRVVGSGAGWSRELIDTTYGEPDWDQIHRDAVEAML